MNIEDLEEYGMMGRRSTTATEDLAMVVRTKLKSLGYFPIYITDDLKRRIQELQEDELNLRREKRFTLDKGVSMLKDIDVINIELTKLHKDHLRKEIGGESTTTARKRKLIKPKLIRKSNKKIVKRKK